MDEFSLEAIRRVPLAEAVMLLWRFATASEKLEAIWDEHRGRCYEGVISFPVMIHLVADALLTSHSARESFRKNIEKGVLEASIQASYRKLGRLPIAVSEGFLQDVTRSLREVFPSWAEWQRPQSLKSLRIVIYDGKAIKRVAKRLKPVRGSSGGLLGGRALVAIDWETGLALAMRCDPDGEANDVKYVGSLVPEVKRELPEPTLHVCDRGFCDLTQPGHFTANEGDHFLVRYHSKVKFHLDSTVPERHGVNHEGHPYVEQWGWIGGQDDLRRRRVRRIDERIVDRDPVILLTSLLDADLYPAIDLLWVYRERWEIERLFQKVTEVFGLSQLIGTTPQATLFQFSFCMVLYNMIQLVRGYVAQAQDLEPDEISLELLFRDIGRELTVWNHFFTPEQTQAYFHDLPTPKNVARQLAMLLRSAWSETWRAAPRQAVHRKTPQKRKRTHGSVHRILFGPPPNRKRRKSADQRCLQR
jgi:hypothetical protein